MPTTRKENDARLLETFVGHLPLAASTADAMRAVYMRLESGGPIYEGQARAREGVARALRKLAAAVLALPPAVDFAGGSDD